MAGGVGREGREEWSEWCWREGGWSEDDDWSEEEAWSKEEVWSDTGDGRLPVESVSYSDKGAGGRIKEESGEVFGVTKVKDEAEEAGEGKPE